MATLTDELIQAAQESSRPDSREQAIIDRHKTGARKESLFQEIAQGEAELEIDMRRQQRAYAEKPPTALAQMTVDPAREMVANLGDRARVLDVYRKLSPEQRQEALKLVPGIAQMGGDDRGGFTGRVGSAVARGIAAVSQPIAELVGAGGSTEEIEFIRKLEGAAAQEFNPARPGDPWYERGPLQAMEMIPWMATTVGGAGLGRAAATGIAGRLATSAAAGSKAASVAQKAGQVVSSLPTRTPVIGKYLPAVTAGKVGELAGITAAAFPSQYAQEVDQLKALGMVDDTRLRLLAGGTAAVTGLVEGIVPNPFGGKVSLTEGAAKAARQYLWESAKKAPGELTEEYLQGVVSGLGEHVAQHIGSEAEGKDADGNVVKTNLAQKKTIADAFSKGWKQAQEAALPMAFLLGSSAVGGASLTAARAQRLQQTLSKGFVSEDDAKQLGIQGNNRKEREANAKAELEKLESLAPSPPPPVQPAPVEPAVEQPTDIATDEERMRQEEAVKAQYAEEIARRRAAKAQPQPTGSIVSPVQEGRTATPPPLPAAQPEIRDSVSQNPAPASRKTPSEDVAPFISDEQISDTVSPVEQATAADAIGERMKIMNTPVVRSGIFTDEDNIRHEMFESDDGKSGIVRSIDVDSGNVVSAKKYPSVNAAKNAFDNVQGSREQPQPTAQPVATVATSESPNKSIELVEPVSAAKSPEIKWNRDDRVFVQGHTTGSGAKIPNSVGKVQKVNADNVLVQIDGETNLRAVSKDKLQLPDATFEKGEKVGLPWAAEKEAKVTDVLPDGRYELSVAGRRVVEPADRMVKLPAAEVKAKPTGDIVSPPPASIVPEGMLDVSEESSAAEIDRRMKEKTGDIVSPGEQVPAAKTPEEHAAIPMFGVYSSYFKGKKKFFVKEFENKGNGDSMFDSLEEANRQSELVRRQDADSKAAEEKRKVDKETEAKKQAEYEASFGGFLSDNAMSKGRQLKVLGASRNYQGKVVTVKDIVEKKVANGAVVDDKGRLMSPDGSWLGSDKLTKIGIDYARHLIEAKAGDIVSPESKRDQEKQDAPKTKKGGDPNEVEAKDGRQKQANADAETKAEAEGQVGSEEGQTTGEAPSPDSSFGEGVTDGFRALPTNGRAAFETEWKKGATSIKNVLYPNNKNYRAEFEARTGVKLPRTVGGTFEAVEKWHNEGRKLASQEIADTKDRDGKLRERLRSLDYDNLRKLNKDAVVQVGDEVISDIGGLALEELNRRMDEEAVATSDDAALEAMIEAEFDKQTEPVQPKKKRSARKEKSESVSSPKKATGRKETHIEQAADKARKEADDLWAQWGSIGGDKLTAGLDPELATLAVQIALAEIKAGTLSFASFVERTAAKIPAAMLEKTKPYMEMAWKVAHKRGMTSDPGGKFDNYLKKNEATSENYGTAEAPNRVALGKYFASRLRDGASYARITDARKEAAELIGGSPKDGTQAIKTIDEAIELGVVMVARDIAQDGDSDSSIYDDLVSLYERQPNLGTRTSTSMLNQAYSTPAPLAFLVNRQAGITQEDTVYDSSAGNGMLLIVGGKRIANELNPDRVEALQSQGIDTTSNDATDFDLGKPITALAINPPFGEIKQEDGRSKQWTVDGVKTDKVDHAITIKSLAEIPDDGKVAIIIGAKGFEQRKSKDDSRRGKAYLNGKAFYDFVYDNYNVTDHYTVDGDLYSRQGASFPVDVIIIEGRGKSSRPKPYNIVDGGIPKVFSSWEDLKNDKLLGNIRSPEGGTGRGAVDSRQEGLSEATIGDTQQGPEGFREGTRGTSQQDIRDSRGPGQSEELGGLDQDANVPGQAESLMGSDRQPRDQARGSEQQSRSDASRDDSRVSGRAKKRDGGRSKLDPLETSEESEVKGDQYQSGYTPSSKSKSVDALIPNNHQTAVQSALDAVEEQYGDIDDFVAKELGIDQKRLHKGFSAEQVDALALAIARHKDGRAFILGDQTGVGKGRVAAGMLIYAKKQGLAPVFVTEKPTLYADIIRDLIDTGFSTNNSPFNPLMTNVTSKKSDQIELPDGRVLKQTAGTAEKNIVEAVGNFIAEKGLVATSKKATKKEAAKTESYDAIFTTYDQMATINGELKPRHLSLQQLSPKAFYVLDESHNAGGSAQDSDREKPQKSDDNKIPVSQMVRDLIENASGVYFSSATYAKRPSVMDLYAKTGMTAATGQDGDSLASSIAAGGVPLQQVVSQQLVESGAYLRRERSFDGVEFKPEVYDVSTEGAEQSAAIFRAINAFDKIKGRLVEEELEDGVTSTGGSIKPDWATGEAGMTSTNFSSILWNLTDQMLLAVKADVIADEAIASIKRGESPVIYVDSTMEAALNAYIESAGLQIGEKSDFSFRDLLQRYLDRSREVLVQRDVEDSKSYEQVRLTDEQLGEAGLAAFSRAQDLIDNFSADLPASPIDWIRKRIEDAGYSFGEYTGRQMVMRYETSDTATVEKRPESEVGAANRIDLIRKFNNGNIDVLLFNQSGSTGISMHASEKVKNQKPRHMIIGQPSKNIDTFMQSLGRVHRTGQVTLPKFTLAMTTLPSEIRPSSVLVKKLASLNANVTASDKGSVSFDVPDVMNMIGDRIVAEYLIENGELNRALNEGEEDGLVEAGRTGQPRVVPGIARKASGRLSIMPIKTQQEFWDSVTETFADTIAELDRIGANPLSARVADLDAKTVESFSVFDGVPDSANVFERPAYVEKVIAKRPGKPMTPEEIMQKVTSFYKLDSSGRKDLEAAMSTWEMNRREEALASTAKRIEEIRNEGLAKGTDPERINSSIDRENQQKNNFLYLMRAFTPGTSVSVWEGGATETLDVIPGVVLSIERKGKEGNPISLSKWRAEIAIGSPDRIIRMSLSQLRVAADQSDNNSGRGREQDDDSEDNVKIFTNREMVSESVLNDFKESEVSTVETRYIGTGNILAAFNLFREQRGRVTFFRDSDGNLQRGVLLPRRFKIDKWIKDQPVSFDRVDQIQRFLASGNNLQTPDRALIVMSVRGGLVLRAPKSKARGGKYTLSKVLLDASSPQEFVSIGSRMEMVIDDLAKQSDVINAILSISGLQATTEKDIARSIKNEGSQKESSDLAKNITKLPETLYQTEDVKPSIRTQALDIALTAEAAGIRTFDKLVAYSVKTVGESRTREIGTYLRLAAEAAGFAGVRQTNDVLGSPNVTREQAVTFAKAAFPMLSDEQIEAGVAIIERIGLLDKVGFAPAGTPIPSLPRSGDAIVRDGEEIKSDRVKGWTQFISATRAVIGATNKADVSTFIHEFFHPTRKFLLDRNIPQEQRFGISDEDIKALEDYSGVKDGNWDRAAEEKAAKAWEQYWFEGRLPSESLSGLFKKMARWMRSVYNGIYQITGGQLPSEVRSLFDKLVQRSGDTEIGDTMSSIEDSDVTSIKNALVNEGRISRGVSALGDVASQTQQEWLDAADAILQDDPMVGDRLVKELNEKPRNLSNIEVAVMQIHYRQMNNRLEKVSYRLFEAKEGKDAAESAKALIDVDIVMNALAEIEEATKKAGREWGRAGVARQIELERDFSLAAIMRKARIANGGNALNEKQLEEMRELARRVAELEGDLAKANQVKLDFERKKNVEAQIEDSKTKTEPIPKAIRKKAVDKLNAFKSKFAAVFASSSKTDVSYATEDEQMADEAESVIQAYVDMGIFSLGEFLANIRKDIGAGLPVSVQAAFATAWKDMHDNGDIPSPMVDKSDVRGLSRLAKQIERSLVEAGITERDKVVQGVHESLQEIVPDITVRETMDAMSGYGQYSYLSDGEADKIIRDINGQLQQLAKLDDMRSGVAPAKTGAERRTMSDEERRLVAQVNEAKRRGGFIVSDPEAQLKTAIAATKTALRNRIKDLQFEIDRKEKIVRTRTDTKSDSEVMELREQRDELMKQHKELFPKPEATMDQRISATSRVLDKVIADLEEQLRTGEFNAKKQSEPISAPELDAKRARIEALREQRDSLRGVQKRTPEQIEKAYKANLLKQLADYKDRMAKSEFDPKPRKEVRVLSQSEFELKKELQDVKDQFFRMAADYRLANMSPRERAWDYVKETAHLSRALMTSLDFSAVFRQGGTVAFSHPKMAAETSKEMYKAMWDAASEFKTAEKIRNDDLYQFAITAGLQITEEEGKITKQEEAYMGRWARQGIGAQGTKLNAFSQKLLTPVAASARGYMTFLNGVRFKLFKHMVSNLGKGGQVTADEAKVIAMYINAATGRSDLGPMMKWAEQMNMLFFAPRFVASRFQYLGMPLWLLGSRNVSGRVKKAIAMEYIRHTGGIGSFLALTVAFGSLLGGDDEEEKPTVSLDPRSSDFLKIKLGETRIDPMSGLSQVMVLASRIASGQRVGADGEVVDLRGENVPYGGLGMAGTVGNFLRTKFAPVPGAAFDIATGENVVGQPVTPFSSIINLFIPLSLREIKETVQSRGIPQGAAITLLSLHGMGASTYGPESNYRKGTPEQREKQFDKDLKKMTFDSKEPAYKGMLTKEQMSQVNERREDRKQGLVYAASANPMRKVFKNDDTYSQAVKERDVALENLKKSGLTLDESRKLLIKHWESSYGSAREMRGGVRVYKEALSDRLKQLRKVYSQ